MKKLAFISLILVFAPIYSVKAQPNGGFENWSTVYNILEPDYWQTLNFVSLNVPNPLSAFRVSGIDKHSGNYALKLKTVYFENNPLPSEIGDSAGAAYTGKVTISPFAYRYGFPYTGRPEKLEFWAKYTPVGDDTAGAIVVLKKWNGMGNDTIAIGGVNINATTGYAPFAANLVYYSNELPDSAVIGFAASKTALVARLNSTVYVDDVIFTGWVGINQYDKKTEGVKIFPNPAKDNVNIHASMEAADKIQIVDASGKIMGTYKIQNCEVNINTGVFADGIYIFKIQDNKNRMLSEGKFNIIK
ncbi:MAG: T9SS type A sorting domain-containing protein [Bacteroidetes bacterium]|nr:T9SS type A sorting domain-containing protein [Bacteroidota bacterium]